jgi:CRISPR/Cas system CSM-associated protein Csm3 (group 7 of RAMP superfamily)
MQVMEAAMNETIPPEIVEPVLLDLNGQRPLHREIVERIVVCGTLVLETPASFGNGDADAWTDMPVLMDELDRSPLLTGTSIAGALRNYLRERARGYEQDYPVAPARRNDKVAEEAFESARKLERETAATILFGGYSGDDDGEQSPLVVHDAFGCEDDYELRDGVKIDGQTRTAEEKKKFDMQLLAAGTKFHLRFDLSISQPPEGDLSTHRESLLRALAAALDGLARGEITLGARKRRGFGRCRVREWRVRRYDLTTRAGLLAWLVEGRDAEQAQWSEMGGHVDERKSPSIITALKENFELMADTRQRCTVQATLEVDGSLMVRSGFGESDKGADMVHLHSKRVNEQGEASAKRRPILAGTSWAGVLRSRALQIANTLTMNTDAVTNLIDGMFGPADIESKQKRSKRESATKEARASRLEIDDAEIHKGIMLQQTRVKIDRFTGGAFESALFSEQPIFGGTETRLNLKLSLRFPVTMQNEQDKQAEIGLLLLLLKDLWTGDLPVGGEVGIGRGRLRGLDAHIQWGSKEWELRSTPDSSVQVAAGDVRELESFVEALGKRFSG